MQFEEELTRVLPPDIPHRDRLIQKAAQHLRLILEANESMNLTRITCPREAAIKHVYDSVAPWQHFRGVKRVLDAGTGAGFPGIPLSLVLPEVRFTLSESTQKKARFVDSAVEFLELPNVHVVAQRAEERADSRHPEIITARAVAPMTRFSSCSIKLSGKALVSSFTRGRISTTNSPKRRSTGSPSKFCAGTICPMAWEPELY